MLWVCASVDAPGELTNSVASTFAKTHPGDTVRGATVFWSNYPDRMFKEGEVALVSSSSESDGLVLEVLYLLARSPLRVDYS